MNQSILDFLILASALIAYFISISLFTTSFYKSRANNYLSLSLFLIASLILIEWHGPTDKYWSFLYFMMLDLVIGVTLFSYFLIQIQHKYLTKRWYKWLYAPFAFSFIAEGVLHLDHVFHLYESSAAEIILYIKDYLSLSFNCGLIIFGRYLIQKSNKISAHKKTWLLRLNFFLILFMLAWILAKAESYVFDSRYATGIPLIIIIILLWWILYYGIFKLQIIAQKEEIHQFIVSKKKISTQVKNNTKPLKAENVSDILAQLYKLMEEETLYKNPLLSRSDLAAQLDISEGYLSQIINQEINKSVIQFVNEYRIKAAQHLLHDPMFNKYSVEAIGLEAGFKSKSAFYNAFKTSLDISPGAYRKLQKTS